jgi:hypothetical protein
VKKMDGILLSFFLGYTLKKKSGIKNKSGWSRARCICCSEKDFPVGSFIERNLKINSRY